MGDIGGVGVDALHLTIVAIYCGLLAVVLLVYLGFRGGDGGLRAAVGCAVLLTVLLAGRPGALPRSAEMPVAALVRVVVIALGVAVIGARVSLASGREGSGGALRFSDVLRVATAMMLAYLLVGAVYGIVSGLILRSLA
jgi:hypothetical protein